MTITYTPATGGYILTERGYITHAPTRAIGIVRILTWLELDRQRQDNTSADYPLSGSWEPYDIEKEKELCL
jgi:hypothetical protein